MFLPLEHKIHIFSPPSNILYILTGLVFPALSILSEERWFYIEKV